MSKYHGGGITVSDQAKMLKLLISQFLTYMSVFRVFNSS
jgi:hypothetical protein